MTVVWDGTPATDADDAADVEAARTARLVVSRASAHRPLSWIDHLRDAMPRPFRPTKTSRKETT